MSSDQGYDRLVVQFEVTAHKTVHFSLTTGYIIMEPARLGQFNRRERIKNQQSLQTPPTAEKVLQSTIICWISCL